MLHQPIISIPRHLGVRAGRVVAELVEIGIRFVRDALAVAIHIDPGEGGGFDRIAAKFPNAVERFVGRLETRRLVIPSGGDGRLPENLIHPQFIRPALDFNPAEWQHHAPLGWREHGGRMGGGALLGIAFVRRGCDDHRLTTA